MCEAPRSNRLRRACSMIVRMIILTCRKLLILAGGMALAGPAFAEVHLPAVLTDHMVLQRGRPVHVWGRADVGEAVTVSFRGQTATATPDELGQWSVFLAPGEAGGPFTLIVKGRNEIEFSDVLVGDVWVASGQSNMEFTTKQAIHAGEELARADRPQIRLFSVNREVSAYPLADLKAGSWTACSPESAKDFSAVAYFFGLQLQEHEHVPIGLIGTYWGGTPAEAWTSMDGLGSDAALMPVFASWGKMADSFSAGQIRREMALAEQAKAKAEGRPAPPIPWSPNDRLSWSPAGLFNAMIAPLTPYPIRGVIWYQGESNADAEHAYLYGRLFQALIRDWRRAWGQEDLPFLFVQIANYKGNDYWPLLREKQREALALRNTGMAVTIDIGEVGDIHPKNKQDVGLRLALAARAVVYGESLEYSGPTVNSVMSQGHELVIALHHTEGGLVARGDLSGFEVAGADGKFVGALASIEGTTVRVSSPRVDRPVAVRYAWKSAPAASLFNGAGLPASPFAWPETEAK